MLIHSTLKHVSSWTLTRQRSCSLSVVLVSIRDGITSFEDKNKSEIEAFCECKAGSLGTSSHFLPERLYFITSNSSSVLCR